MTKEIIENDPYKLAGVDINAGNELVEKIKNGKCLSLNEYQHLKKIKKNILKLYIIY